MTDINIETIRGELDRLHAAAAQPAPWRYEDGVLVAGDGDRSGLSWLSCCNMDDSTMEAIAALHNNWPAISAALAERAELERELASTKRALEHANDHIAGLYGQLKEAERESYVWRQPLG